MGSDYGGGGGLASLWLQSVLFFFLERVSVKCCQGSLAGGDAEVCLAIVPLDYTYFTCTGRHSFDIEG